MDMELYFLDASLRRMRGPVEALVSLTWEEVYGGVGSYRLVLPASWFSVVTSAAYVCLGGRTALGRVECFRLSEEEDRVTVSGRMAESLLFDRVIPRGTVLSGNLTRAVEALVSDHAGQAAGDRRIPVIAVAASPLLTDAEGNAYSVDAAVGGKTLGACVSELLAEAEAAYCLIPDCESGMLYFTVYRGEDRTRGQTERGPIVLSRDADTLMPASYVLDSRDHKNYAYIAGEGTGTERITETLDLREGAEEPLRELYVDARDLRSADFATEAAYRAALRRRGRERLVSYKTVRTLSADLSPSTELWGMGEGGVSETGAGPVLGRDYGLGDLCDVVLTLPPADAGREGYTAEHTMHFQSRITAITISASDGGILIRPRLGEAYPDLRRFLWERMTPILPV